MHYFGVENLTTLMRNLFNTFIGSCLISALRHDLSAGNVFSLRVRERERGRECVCVSLSELWVLSQKILGTTFYAVSCSGEFSQ